jgi:hypothetical protein
MKAGVNDLEIAIAQSHSVGKSPWLTRSTLCVLRVVVGLGLVARAFGGPALYLCVILYILVITW